MKSPDGKLSRRYFLCWSIGLILSGTALKTFFNTSSALAIQKEYNWRFCKKCNAIFFDGRKAKGRCWDGHGHMAAGYNFYMVTAAVGENIPPGQDGWRVCKKCLTMFYGGYKSHGRCSAGGQHVGQTELYSLEYDRPAGAGEQRDWRFCDKCYSLFFDGYPTKGRCPTGNGHSAQGYNFVLKWGTRID